MIKIIAKNEDKLINYLTNFEGLNYNKVQTLLRKKDIKLNGKKVKSDTFIKKDDEIILYANSNELFNYTIIFEDENILIVNKPKKLEVVSTTRNLDLCKLLPTEVFPVHRLDYNTEGLVIFAKNENSYNELLTIFKERQIKKKYLCVACGNLVKKCHFSNYLIDKKDGKVSISNSSSKGAQEILLSVEPIENIENFCLLDVDLLTGKTHQIRAQLAFNNLFVLGDEKYGNSKINKKFGYKNQVLVSYYIKFALDKNIKTLQYLNNREFVLNENNVIKIFNNLKSLNNA